MNDRSPNSPLEKNLETMLRSTLGDPNPSFQETLTRDVLREVKQQGQRESQSIRFKRLLAGIAAIMLVVVALRWGVDNSMQPVAQVTNLYGQVTVQSSGASQTIQHTVDLRSGQRVKTAPGSRARISLNDQSLLIPDPRTILKVDATRQGPTVALEQGAVTIEARKQARGQAIGIRAGGSRIKVLGTKLDVRLVKKPDGTEQAYVRVFSGCVELASGGSKVLVLPGTEAVADEGQAPVRSSVVFEVNELMRLFHQSNASDDLQGLPAIIDFTKDTLWTLVPGESLAKTGPNTFDLMLNYPAFGSRAYTVEGVEIATQGNGKALQLDTSSTPSQEAPEYLIIKMPRVRGWFRVVDEGLYACDLHGNETDPLSLIQFHLPQHTQIEDVSQEIIEKTSKRNRLIVTIAAKTRLPQILDTN